jgi:hypothetical protein
MAGVDTVRGLGDAAALAEVGDWSAAQEAYAAVLALGESADARWGLARAGWWLGAARSAVEDAERAFAAYDAEARHADAAMVGLHISIWYLTNFDNPSAAAGWLARARRSAETSGDEGAVAWSTLVSAYVADEPDEGLRLIEAAAAKAASLPDRDLSTMALADLGLWHVGAGDVDLGMSIGPPSGVEWPTVSRRPTAVRSSRPVAALTTVTCWWRPAAGTTPNASSDRPWPWPATPVADPGTRP